MISLRSLRCCLMIAGFGLAAAGTGDGTSGAILERVTEILNPKGDSTAVLEVTEWENGKIFRQGIYRAFFHGQDVLLLRKSSPETDRGRSILMRANNLWIELPSARRPLQLSSEQRLTSEATVADLARANFKRDYHVERITEEPRPASSQHLFLHAARQDVPYGAVELWLDKKTEAPRRARFINTARTLSKNCEYSSYQRVLGMERPLKFSCTEVGRSNWKAELLFKGWTQANIDLRFLDPSALGKEESVVITPKEEHGSGRSERHLNDMVFVPEGEFTMGRDNGFPDEQPSHKVYVSAFWIDRMEVTVTEYRNFMRTTRRASPHAPSSPSMPSSYFLSDKFAHFPVVDVSWQDANDYCHWKHKRLPTEAEWEKAARGTDQRIYPWGNIWDEDKANSRETPYSSVAGTRLHFTSEVGIYGQNASPYGALDMAGNAWEWVADWYTAYPGNHSPNEAYGLKYRVIRGGSWVSNSLALTTVARDYSNPAFGYDSVGFRCAKEQ